MRYDIVTLSQIPVCFFQIELTRSQSQNFSIIRQHWLKFNALLRAGRLSLGSNWKKYGITKKIQNRYYYQCACPSGSQIRQFGFTIIPPGTYLKFTHEGSMSMIAKTVNEMYRTVIPGTQFGIDRNRSLVHFERYDARFNWNNKDSILELFVPVTRE